MIYVGIDVSKFKHDCCVLSADGQVLVDNFSFKNNRDGFNLFMKKIKGYLAKNIKVGLEATGHYHENLLNFLIENGFSVFLLNPLLVSRYGDSQSLRKTKTDKADAKLIAKLASVSELQISTELLYQNKELKSFTRLRKRSVDRRSKDKVALNNVIDKIFPELTDVVKSLDLKSVRAMLMEFPSLEEIANCHLTKLTNILKKASRGALGKEKAKEIKEAAKKSIGKDCRSLTFELKQILLSLDMLDEQIKEIDSEIKEIMDEIDSVILTVPGISYILGSTILAEIGDIKRFDNPAKILAYAGLEPGVYQSGTYQANRMKMVKRGSRYLRYALIQAADQIRRYDPTFKAYYDKKIEEGKPRRVVLTHVARKLIRVLFKLLSDDEEFVPQAS